MSGCQLCGGTGVVRTMADETEIGQSPGSSARPCPECARNALVVPPHHPMAGKPGFVVSKPLPTGEPE